MSLLRRMRSLTHRRRRAADLQDELRFHLDTEAEERQAAGASADEAKRDARIDFGNVAVVAEDTRATWGWTTAERLGQDARYAFRTLSKTRAFTATAVLSLGLGIGANTLLFSLTDAILVRMLPVADPETLVRMTWRTPKPENHGLSRHASAIRSATAGYTNGTFAYAAFEQFRDRDDLFSSVFAYQSTRTVTLNIQDEAARATGEYVSGDYFRGLGIMPAAGRWIVGDDDRDGAPPVVVIATALANGRFGGPGAAVGQTLLINNARFTVVGVTPSAFFGTDPGVTPDFYLPLHAISVIEPRRDSNATDRFSDPAVGWLEIMARLRPGVSLEQAHAMLAPPFQQFTERVRAGGTWKQAPTLALVAGGQGIDGLRRGYSTPLVFLLGLAGLILLLACANIANLLLARSAAREREIAVRLSLGASRARVIRQLVTESVVLSSIGGALGVILAVVGEPLVTALLANGRPNFTLHADLNWRVLAFSAALSVLTGLLFGIVPAIRSTRHVLQSAIRGGRLAAPSASSRRAGPARAMVVLQMGGTLVLLVTAGLFARTLSNFAALDLGFNPNHVLTVTLDATQAGFDQAAAAQIYRDLRRRLSAQPEFVSVGMSDMPLLGDGSSSATVIPVGRASTGSSSVMHVGAGFLRTLEAAIIRGRDITEDDEKAGAKPVVVVSDAYARAHFGDENPLGQLLNIPGESPELARLNFEIVGVVRDLRYGRLLDERPRVVFVPSRIFDGEGHMVFAIRTHSDPMRYEQAVRQIVRETSSRIPITRVATQTSLIDRLIPAPILLTRLSVALAILALTIAVVGIYGNVAYDVSRRTREIGVRMALGARPAQVIWLVLGTVSVLATAGVAVGVPAALAASSIAESYLYGVTSRDPITIAGAIGVLLGAACLASYAPARVAAAMNPTAALRNE